MPEIRYAGYMATMLLFRRIYAKAKELLLMDTEEPNESQEAYFIHLPYLKKNLFCNAKR